MALAWHPVQSGEVQRKGCITSSAAGGVSMLVYIDIASHEKKETFDLMALFAELLI